MIPSNDEFINDIKTTIHHSMPIVESCARALAILQATQEHEEAWVELGSWVVTWLGYIGDLQVAKESAEDTRIDHDLVKLVSIVLHQMGEMKDDHIRLMQLADTVTAEIVRKRDG